MKHLSMIVSTTFFLLAGTAYSQAPNLKCSPELLATKCVDHSLQGLDLRKSKSEADGIKFNYFLWGKRDHHDELQKFAASSSETDQDRALAIADNARKRSIEYVTGGRDPALWSNETRTIVERIRMIEFRISDSSSSDCFEATDPGLPNAAYSAMEHSIGICHSLVKTHSNVITATILHEIGHAVSSCNMKKPLIRHRELTDDAIKCLNLAGAGIDSETIGEAEYERFVEEGELTSADRSLARSISEIKLGVDVSATNTETLLRCGAVERIPNSNLEFVRSNSGFDQCARKRYSGDYEKYVAHFSLYRDTLPIGMTKKEQDIVNGFKENNPESCYRKSEEHFADSFSAAALAHWHKNENKGLQDFRLSTYDLTQTYCMGRIEERNVSNPHLYPSDETRLLSYLAPTYFQSLLGCSGLSKPVCSMPIDPASLTVTQKPPSGNGERSQKRGTAK